MVEEISIRAIEEMLRWAEHEGAFDDSVLVSWTESSICVALRILEDAPSDPRDPFRRNTERYQSFTLVLTRDGELSVAGVLESHSPFECEMVEEGAAFGLQLRCGEATLRAVATEWSASAGEELVIPIERWLNLPELTFHGPGPVDSQSFLAALAEHGAQCDLYGNWHGSDQSFGAAFVRDVAAPRAIHDAEELADAWRVVPVGVSPEDLGGLWVTGRSAPGSAYAILQRRAATQCELIRSTMEALASLPGLTWASSGNTLIEEAAGREAWHAAAYPS